VEDEKGFCCVCVYCLKVKMVLFSKKETLCDDCFKVELVYFGKKRFVDVIVLKLSWVLFYVTLSPFFQA
jgi:hypothetical protein